MARASDAIAENVAGDFFVDSSCIDCDLCRQLAPTSFARSDFKGQSYVASQPATAHDEHRALMALVTCPTSSIGTRRKLDSRAAARAFPMKIEIDVRAPDVDVPDIYFCGYASADSYGASAYLIRRPDGNVLVDSPRAAKTLMDRVAELGGVRLLVLTHRDDVADHREWHERFGCERVIHRDDVAHATRECERIVDGETWLAEDLLVIPVPGHTRGSIALLHRAALFTGDHLWATDDETGLDAGRDVCWYSWPEQKRSIEKLVAYDFDIVLPGHGRSFRAPDASTMREHVRSLARRM